MSQASQVGQVGQVSRALPAMLLVLAACASARSQMELGHRSARANEWDRAVAHYETALSEKPGDIEARIALQRARLEASWAHLSRARDHEEASELEQAATELELALHYDPTNDHARAQLAELRLRIEERDAPQPHITRERLFAGEPVLDPASDAPIDLSFAERTSLRTILEALARLAGVNILFDEAYRDREVSVELKGVTFRQALELLLVTNGLFYKVVESETVRVTPEGRE